jgi:hypothetical protein
LVDHHPRLPRVKMFVKTIPHWNPVIHADVQCAVQGKKRRVVVRQRSRLDHQMGICCSRCTFPCLGVTFQSGKFSFTNNNNKRIAHNMIILISIRIIKPCESAWYAQLVQLCHTPHTWLKCGFKSVCSASACARCTFVCMHLTYYRKMSPAEEYDSKNCAENVNSTEIHTSYATRIRHSHRIYT